MKLYATETLNKNPGTPEGPLYIIRDGELLIFMLRGEGCIIEGTEPFTQNVLDGKDVHIDFTSETRVQYKIPPGPRRPRHLIVCTQDSYTDNGEDDTMTYFYYSIPESLSTDLQIAQWSSRDKQLAQNL